jgi:hypothetical protein
MNGLARVDAGPRESSPRGLRQLQEGTVAGAPVRSGGCTCSPSRTTERAVPAQQDHAGRLIGATRSLFTTSCSMTRPVSPVKCASAARQKCSHPYRGRNIRHLGGVRPVAVSGHTPTPTPVAGLRSALPGKVVAAPQPGNWNENVITIMPTRPWPLPAPLRPAHKLCQRPLCGGLGTIPSLPPLPT